MLGKTVGKTDAIIRIVIGIALIVGYFMNSDGAYSWLYILGAVIMIGTALTSRCLIYSLTGMSTRGSGDS